MFKDLYIEKLQEEVYELEEEIFELKCEVEELREYKELYLDLLEKLDDF